MTDRGRSIDSADDAGRVGNAKTGRETVTINAHAKINLYLKVLAREASGYHAIETIFQRIALHDVVQVSLSADRRVVCSGPAMPANGLGNMEDNLAFRAAALYMDVASLNSGFDIAITKHIPVGGGLGGGSADAAAVLRALQQLTPKPLTDDVLFDIGVTLGADVPFLLTGWSRALAWGRGERMLKLDDLSSVPVALYTFAEGVNTGTAYRALAETREQATQKATPLLLTADMLSSWYAVQALAHNDFESIVQSMHQGVAHVLESLRAAQRDGDIVLMSGSGATCFLISDNASPAIPAPSGGTLVHSMTI